MQQGHPKALRYDPALDGLRAIAVSAVVFYHSGVPGFTGGLRGVDLFFVLSGYLITSMLAGGSMSVGEFWRRRIFRLMPALVAMVTLSLAITPLVAGPIDGGRLRSAALALTYTMNLAEALRPWDNPFMHTWSLAAEMQFYLLWPFVLPWLIRNRPGPALVALWAAITVATYAMDAFTSLDPYFFPHFGGLALGAAIVFLPPATNVMGIAGFSLIAAAFINPNIPIFEVELGAALVISSLRQQSALRPMLESPPLVRLGLISYGVYLWHFTIFTIVGDAADWTVKAPLELGGGILLGWLSYRLIELPFAKRLRPATAISRRELRGLDDADLLAPVAAESRP